MCRVGDRAVAAGLKAWWTRFKNPATGEPEGPYGLRVELRSGRRTRSINIHGGAEAEALSRHPFERWTVLDGYEAILDPHEHRIVAAVHLRGTSLSKIPGVTTEPPEEPEISSESSATLRPLFGLPGEQPGPRTVRIASSNGGLVVELRSRTPAEIRALHGSSSRYGYTLTIRGVSTNRHDDARTLLEGLSTSVFLDLDRGYGLTGTLHRSSEARRIDEEYDEEVGSTLTPRMPSVRYGNDAASLYLYARNLPHQMPLLEYLAYYQVIEHYLPTFTKIAAIVRIRNMLKDPRFDHSDDVAVGRLIEAVLPGGRTMPSEREQVFTTVDACLDNVALADFFEIRPATARALHDKRWITGVRPINPGDSNTGLVKQVSDRIYDLRCRIVHSKESFSNGAGPLRPFEPEGIRLRHDLHLIRFVAQHVLIASSVPAAWS